MSPKNFPDITDQASSIKLRINKDSPYIRKHPSVVRNDNSAPAKPQRPPVIIYMHTPKIIHSNPRDFMSLVQKLTGLSSSEDGKAAVKSEPEKSVGMDSGGSEESESTSGLIEEKVLVGEVKQESTIMLEDYSQYMVDAPLFTPNSGEIFCPSSSRANSLFQLPTMVNPVSPSLMEFMNRLPEG